MKRQVGFFLKREIYLLLLLERGRHIVVILLLLKSDTNHNCFFLCYLDSLVSLVGVNLDPLVGVAGYLADRLLREIQVFRVLIHLVSIKILLKFNEFDKVVLNVVD